MNLALLDYGVGNMHSLRKALELAGANVTVVTDPKAMEGADALVLPGVGAFGAAMEKLAEFREPLLDAMGAGTPTFAVCLGMQLLFEASEESPGVAGLGFIHGDVVRFEDKVGKVPLMGWTGTRTTKGAAMDPVVAPRADAPFYYFVHSYYCRPHEDVTLATATYGSDFPAIVRKKNVWATQFHPEKSSDEGLALLRRFVAFAAEASR